MKEGRITRISGPVVDVRFEDGLPRLRDALAAVTPDGERKVMEVAQHIGRRDVRCIMLSESEGLSRDMRVEATGKCIEVPVGEVYAGQDVQRLRRAHRRRRGDPAGRRAHEHLPSRTFFQRAELRRGDLGDGHQSHRPSGAVRQGRQDRALRRRGRRQDRAHTGAHPQRRHQARRLFRFHGSGRCAAAKATSFGQR